MISFRIPVPCKYNPNNLSGKENVKSRYVNMDKVKPNACAEPHPDSAWCGLTPRPLLTPQATTHAILCYYTHRFAYENRATI